MLTGFSQFSPIDGVPAADSTEVLVWYSPTAIHFGIRAFEAHGAVHATLADRDKIGADDYVQILLGTFDDGRQAIGVRGEPVRRAVGRRAGRDRVHQRQRLQQRRGAAGDRRSEPRLRVRLEGPAHRLRLRGRGPDSVQEPPLPAGAGAALGHQRHPPGAALGRARTPGRRPSGPARRSWRSRATWSASPTCGAGWCSSSIRRSPRRTTGAPGANGWDYAGGGPELGGTVRWGVTNNLTLNGTANPDFSQVESDAGQFLFDPRNELFFSEKRPFFLDGIEQFTTPNSLIYTRRIVQPVAAAKLTGKGFGTDIALLSAVDDPAVSADRRRTIRSTTCSGSSATSARSRGSGVVYTDRIVGSDYNRVAGADARLLFGEVYSVQLQLAGSRTRTARRHRRRRRSGTPGSPGTAAPSASAPQLNAQRSRLPRPERVLPAARAVPRQPRSAGDALRQGRAALVESVTGDVNLDGLYRYDQFVTGAGMQDEKLHFNTNVRLRGGWTAGASVLIEAFGYPSEVYAGLPDRAAARGRAGWTRCRSSAGRRFPTATTCCSSRRRSSPSSRATLFVLWGHDENFYEWASADLTLFNAGLDWRPTDQLRLNGTYQLQRVGRRTDGSTVNIQHIPRLKIEYQLSRPIFLRLVGEYTSERQDALRDDTRTEAPLLIFDPEVGDFVRAAAFTRAVVPRRPAVLVPAESGHGAVRRVREHAAGPGGSRGSAPDRAPAVGRRVLPQDELSVSDVAGRRGSAAAGSTPHAPPRRLPSCHVRPTLPDRCALFGRALRLRCPNCGQGRLFDVLAPDARALSRSAGSSSSAARRATRWARTCSTSSRRSWCSRAVFVAVVVLTWPSPPWKLLRVRRHRADGDRARSCSSRSPRRSSWRSTWSSGRRARELWRPAGDSAARR